MKSTSSAMRKPVSVVLPLLFVAVAAVSASAQSKIVYDWESRGRRSCPAEINQTKSVDVVIRNINNILFTYRIDVAESRRALDDWKVFAGGITRSTRSVTSKQLRTESRTECQKLVEQGQKLIQDIEKAIEQDPNLPLGYAAAGKIVSVKLSATLRAWNSLAGDYDRLTDLVAKLKAGDCADDPRVIDFLNAYGPIEKDLRDAMAGLRELVTTRSHDYREEFEIRPNTDYTFTVDELYGSTKTEGGTESFQCNPASAQLTLTTGILFSRIPDRGYEARKVPGITDNQLVVEGNSDFRPEGVALLNYLLPYLDRETTGLALSAGPVVRFGSKSDVSTLGFFAGVSGHLYRRLYITPGFHFGEFADFPAGFQEGQAVPTDFGTLSPVKRWTTRFALGISFRTASFGGVFGSDEGGDKKKETVRKDGGAEGNRPSRTGTLTASARPDSSGGTTPASYDDAPADVDPSFMRTASLRTSSSKQGPLVTIAADSPLHDYTTFSNGSVFYLVLPNATGKLNPQLMDGRGLGSVRLEQSGSNLVISFIVPRGSAARVRQKFNRLEVLFTAEGAEPTGATVLAGAMRD